MPTVAMVVIGDEILSGKYVEENAAWVIGRLRGLGAELRRVAIIGDEVSEIAEEVRRCAERYDLVVTSGGVGPTHDDRTLEGVAAAFDLPLRVVPELVALLERFQLPREGPSLRLVTLPEGAELVDGPRGFPVVRVRNVYVLPGVPKLFRAKFEAVAEEFRGQPPASGRVVTLEDETALAARLDAVVAAFPDVKFGSYPRFELKPIRVVLTAEASTPARVREALDALAATIAVVEREDPA